MFISSLPFYNNKSVSRCLLTRDNKFTVLLLVLLWPGSEDERSCTLLNNCLLISCIITINYAGIWRMLMNCKLLMLSPSLAALIPALVSIQGVLTKYAPLSGYPVCQKIIYIWISGTTRTGSHEHTTKLYFLVSYH